jgi:hypothetical protein
MSFNKKSNKMAKKNLLISAVVMGMALMLTNCENVRCIKGNDNLVSEKINNLESFDKIYVDANFDVIIEQDTITEVSILADDNLIPYITAEVSGNELILSTANRRCLRSKNEIRINVFTPNIVKIELEGSGDIETSNITLDKDGTENKLEVILDGSGDIDLGEVYCDDLIVDLIGSGDIDFADIDVLNLDVLLQGSGDIGFLGGIGEIGLFTLDGSGNIYADRVKLLEGDVDVLGSGDIYVWAEEHLYGQITGSGNVIYRIFPTKGIHINITGSGSVYPL